MHRKNATTGAEARIIGRLDAALKRRSSTSLPASFLITTGHSSTSLPGGCNRNSF